MTWGEFKKAVEAKGIADTDQVAWIDITTSVPEDIEVHHDVDGWEIG